MSATPERIYAWPSLIAKWLCGGWSQTRFQDDAAAYILATPAALADSPEVAAIVAEAVAKERERCAGIAVRHWEGEPEDTIAMVAEIRSGGQTEYERKVAQMKEDFPNGI